MPNNAISSSFGNRTLLEESHIIRENFYQKSKELKHLLTETKFYLFLKSGYIKFIFKQIPLFEKEVEASPIDDTYQSFYNLTVSLDEEAQAWIIQNRDLVKWWSKNKEFLMATQQTSYSNESNSQQYIEYFNALEAIHINWQKIQKSWEAVKQSPLEAKHYSNYLNCLVFFQQAHSTLSNYFPSLSSHATELNKYINTAIRLHRFYNTPNPKTKQLIADTKKYYETVIKLDVNENALADYAARITDCLILCDSKFASFTNQEYALYTLADEWLSAKIYQGFQKSEEKINAFIQMIAEGRDNIENPEIEELITQVEGYHTTLNNLHAQEGSLNNYRKKIQDLLIEYDQTFLTKPHSFNRWEHHLYRLAIRWNHAQIQGTDEEMQKTAASMKTAIHLVNDYLPKEKTAEEKEEEKKAASLAAEKEQTSLQLNGFFKSDENNRQEKAKLRLCIP